MMSQRLGDSVNRGTGDAGSVHELGQGEGALFQGVEYRDGLIQHADTAASYHGRHPSISIFEIQVRILEISAQALAHWKL